MIGIGAKGGHVQLLCEVMEVTPSYVKFMVINGRWIGYLVGDMLLAFSLEAASSKHNPTTSSPVTIAGGMHVLYKGPVHAGYGCEQTIDIMNEQLSRSWVTRVGYKLTWAVQGWCWDMSRKVKRSVKALRKAWNMKIKKADYPPFLFSNSSSNI